ncbi:MAG: VTC domain-containing protein [Flavobacteriales bacterium]|nr:VTC domain-containing protein [Flavobacteriales bacterium]
MLNEHLRGKLNRVKVRVREYVESNKTFFEIKLKTNKGKTLKSRMRKIGNAKTIDPKEASFLAKRSSVTADRLSPVIDLDFSRVTLVSTEYKERITFDFNLTFLGKSGSKSAKELVIVELKRDGESAPRTPIKKVLKKFAVHPSSMSKYCIGMILFGETERYNQYKPKLLTLNKLSTNGNIW